MQSKFADDKKGDGKNAGMLQAVIDTVIGNLQLSITNIHIRYEVRIASCGLKWIKGSCFDSLTMLHAVWQDAQTNPQHPFTVGITLDKMAASTVDEQGQEAFVKHDPMQLLRKVLVHVAMQPVNDEPIAVGIVCWTLHVQR